MLFEFKYIIYASENCNLLKFEMENICNKNDKIH